MDQSSTLKNLPYAVSNIIKVPYLGNVSDINDMCLLRTLVYQFLYSFYEGSDQVPIGQINDIRYLRSYLTLFKTLAPLKIKEADINEILLKYGMAVKFEECRNMFSFMSTLDRMDCSLSQFMEWFETIMLWKDDRLCLIVFAMALTTIGKYPNPQNFRKYQEKFAKSLCESMNIEFNKKVFDLTYISHGPALKSYYAFKSNFELRQEIFRFLIEYDKVANNHMGTVIDHVLKSISFMESSSEFLLEYYMVKLNKEFLCYLEKDKNYCKKAFNEMVLYLIEHKKEYPLMKILVRPEDYEPSNENHLKKFYYATQLFVKSLDPQLNKYHVITQEPTPDDLKIIYSNFVASKVLEMTLAKEKQPNMSKAERDRVAIIKQQLGKTKTIDVGETFDVLMRRLKTYIE